MDSAGDQDVRHAVASQGVPLGHQQQELTEIWQGITTMFQHYPAIFQHLDLTQADQAAASASAAPVEMEAPASRRPDSRLISPTPYTSEPTSCNSFLSQCYLTFSLPASCFCSDALDGHRQGVGNGLMGQQTCVLQINRGFSKGALKGV